MLRFGVEKHAKNNRNISIYEVWENEYIYIYIMYMERVQRLHYRLPSPRFFDKIYLAYRMRLRFPHFGSW